MTLPALITVTGVIRDQDGPVAGKLVFYRSTVIFPASTSDENLLIPEEVVVVVGVDGLLSQPLYSGNDPAASPTGWTWEVRPHFPNWKTSFSIVVPYDAPGGTISLNELAPVPPEGTGQLYALVNHTHPGGGSITYGPVTAETTYGASSNSGASDAVSRADHRHGNPALPTPADIGASSTSHNHNAAYDALGAATAAVATHEADTTSVHGIANTANLIVEGDSRLTNPRTPTTHASSHADGGADEVSVDGSQVTTGTVGFARLPTGVGSSQVAVGNHTHAGGGGSTPSVVSAVFATGDITAPNDGSTWTPMSGVTNLSLAAVVGDRVELMVIGLLDHNASFTDYFEPVVIASGGGIARYASTGTSSPSAAGEGDPAQYPDGSRFGRWVTGFTFVVGSGDLTAGNVVFGIAHKGPGGGKLQSGNYQTRWWARNDHQ